VFVFRQPPSCLRLVDIKVLILLYFFLDRVWAAVIYTRHDLTGRQPGVKGAQAMTLVNRTQLKQAVGGVSTSTIDRWERQGRIPRAIRRPGMLPRWVLEDVLAAIGITERQK
jgi:predicted DNA-binding transcriptional regulator AlpA